MAEEWVILHGGALGDLVLTIQLALRLPGVIQSGRLRLISRSRPGELSTCRPSIRHKSADASGSHWLYTAGDELPPAMLAGEVRGAYVLNALGDKQSVVHRCLLRLRPAALLSFDPRPQAALRRHITQQWQTALEAQGLLIPKCVHQHPTHRSLGVSEELRAHGRQVLRHAGSDAGCILIHPGSGGRDKCWPLANFVSVARRLRSSGRAVCLLVGPVEMEWWPERQLEEVGREFPVLRLPAADDLAAALAAARLLIANDSGPAHLAALLGTPTIAVFGPTDPVVWRPLGRQVRVIAGDPRLHPQDWGIDPGRVAWLATTADPGLRGLATDTARA